MILILRSPALGYSSPAQPTQTFLAFRWLILLNSGLAVAAPLCGALSRIMQVRPPHSRWGTNLNRSAFL